MVKDTAVSSGGLGFDSRAGQIEQSVATALIFFRSCASMPRRGAPPLVTRFGIIPQV